MIEWLILTYLDNHSEASIINNTSSATFIPHYQNNHTTNKQQQTTTFGLEYATAMLMNLAQNTISQTTLLRHKDQLYSLLLRLLNSRHRQVNF